MLCAIAAWPSACRSTDIVYFLCSVPDMFECFVLLLRGPLPAEAQTLNVRHFSERCTQNYLFDTSQVHSISALCRTHDFLHQHRMFASQNPPCTETHT